MTTDKIAETPTELEVEEAEGLLCPEFQAILDELIVKAEKGELVGKFKNIPNEVYHHKNCPGFSKSKLDKVDKSWNHTLVPWKETPALVFGSAFHDLILEPHIFYANNVQGSTRPEAPEAPKPPKKWGRKKAEQEEKKKWETEVLEVWRNEEYLPFLEDVIVPWDLANENKKRWSDKDWETMLKMKEACDDNEFLQALMKDAEFEVTFFWVDKKTGLLCKCRPDIINFKLKIIADLKTTQDASFKDFRKSIANFKYDKQASYYLEGVNKALEIQDFETFVFIPVEKAEPFGIALYNLDEASLDIGKQLWRRSLDKVFSIQRGETDKGYFRAIQNINLPAWGFDIDAR